MLEPGTDRRYYLKLYCFKPVNNHKRNIKSKVALITLIRIVEATSLADH